ncbi:flagellar biosynthesis protein FlgG [Helicobacter pylori]
MTVWCCLVIHGDQRREEIEQLINTIKVDSGKSLHQETQQANEANKTWYLAIVFLIGLAVLAVFFIKGKHHSSNDPSNNPKSGVEKLKNPSHKNYKKNDNNHSKTQNHSKHKNNKGAEIKER